MEFSGLIILIIFKHLFVLAENVIKKLTKSVVMSSKKNVQSYIAKKLICIFSSYFTKLHFIKYK